jgi:hypothetical protein
VEKTLSATPPPIVPAGPASGRIIRRVAIVTDRENPSFDYYFAPRLAMHPGPPVARFDLSAPRRDREGGVWTDTLVIFCRYASAAWLRSLRARERDLAGIGLFLDDDIEALAAARETRWRYRLKLQRYALRRWPELRPSLGRVWTSTAPIARRWAAMAPVLLPPLAGEVDLASSPVCSERPLVGLHATGSHVADQLWLEPVVRGALAADPNLEFEVVADRWSERRWRGDPRVRVVPYRSWPQYRADTAAHGRDLLLAPLLPTAANAARADVKRIDAARCGAALLVSDKSVYQVSPEEAALGMIAPLDVEAWTRAIVGLMSDSGRRAALVQLNRAKLNETRRAATALFESADGGKGEMWRLA